MHFYCRRKVKILCSEQDPLIVVEIFISQFVIDCIVFRLHHLVFLFLFVVRAFFTAVIIVSEKHHHVIQKGLHLKTEDADDFFILDLLQFGVSTF